MGIVFFAMPYPFIKHTCISTLDKSFKDKEEGGKEVC